MVVDRLKDAAVHRATYLLNDDLYRGMHPDGVLDAETSMRGEGMSTTEDIEIEDFEDMIDQIVEDGGIQDPRPETVDRPNWTTNKQQAIGYSFVRNSDDFLLASIPSEVYRKKGEAVENLSFRKYKDSNLRDTNAYIERVDLDDLDHLVVSPENEEYVKQRLSEVDPVYAELVTSPDDLTPVEEESPWDEGGREQELERYLEEL